VKVAVTGGAGFIGHHLVRGLLDRGHDVAVIDDLSTGRRSRIEPHLDRIAFTEGSVLDRAALDEALAGCRVVLHSAAIASVARSLEEPRHTNEVNVGGTIEVVLAAARGGARRVILASSSAVYGIPEELPCREDLLPAPESPYGAGKLAAEHYLHGLGRLHGVDTVALRYFNVYGPGQDPASEYAAVVPRFITAVAEGGRPVFNGAGDITRDFVFVDDVVEANVLAAADGGPSGLTCNIASGDRTSLRQLLDAICAAAGREVEPVIGPARPGDIPHSQAAIALGRNALGFEARVGLREGIARTYSWFADDRVGAAEDTAAGLSGARQTQETR
jgi:UDP-glucose 4-epimerase